MSGVKAVSLLSGGLDSILATRVVQDQGVEVKALHFISPFFCASVKGREEATIRHYREKFSIDTEIIDVSREFLEIVDHPRYGYGKNFNPCIDCKIFLFKKALKRMEESGAKFLITGEVVGQRPMSQRRGTMDLIAAKMGAKDILLRPLCAKILPLTLPEREGWVDREKLHSFSGRGRKAQIALAEELGISGYPTPAGGCSLTDPIKAVRVRKYFDKTDRALRNPDEIRLLLSGRPFCFPGGSILTMGRSEGENNALKTLFREGDELVKVPVHPGPLGIFRPGPGGDERALAASVLLRYCPRAPEECEVGFGVVEDEPERMIKVRRASDEDLDPFRV
ncbi:thiamine biosynthesis protein [bacterium]|nr:MAG: thiamine biosynthesis protein [bacterium]